MDIKISNLFENAYDSGLGLDINLIAAIKKYILDLANDDPEYIQLDSNDDFSYYYCKGLVTWAIIFNKFSKKLMETCHCKLEITSINLKTIDIKLSKSSNRFAQIIISIKSTTLFGQAAYEDLKTKKLNDLFEYFDALIAVRFINISGTTTQRYPISCTGLFTSKGAKNLEWVVQNLKREMADL